MMRHALILLACLAFGSVVPSVRAEGEAGSDARAFRAKDTPQFRADKAYVLLRFDTTLSPFAIDLLRIPDQDELDAYEAAKIVAHAKAGPKAPPIEAFAFDYGGRSNLYELTSKKWFAQDAKIKTVLAEVPPGDYVLYGQGIGGFMVQCMCLGTVGFPLPAGRITDLGTVLLDYADRPSVIPELASETNLGPSAKSDYVLLAVGLRPPRAGERIPVSLEPANIASPRLHAVGPFVEPNTYLINRLAPIPGVLAYEAGHVIDVPSGKQLPRTRAAQD